MNLFQVLRKFALASGIAIAVPVSHAATSFQFTHCPELSEAYMRTMQIADLRGIAQACDNEALSLRTQAHVDQDAGKSSRLQTDANIVGSRSALYFSIAKKMAAEKQAAGSNPLE